MGPIWAVAQVGLIGLLICKKYERNLVHLIIFTRHFMSPIVREMLTVLFCFILLLFMH